MVDPVSEDKTIRHDMCQLATFVIQVTEVRGEKRVCRPLTSPIEKLPLPPA
jgi:hypothetical protein